MNKMVFNIESNLHSRVKDNIATLVGQSNIICNQFRICSVIRSLVSSHESLVPEDSWSTNGWSSKIKVNISSRVEVLIAEGTLDLGGFPSGVGLKGGVEGEFQTLSQLIFNCDFSGQDIVCGPLLVKCDSIITVLVFGFQGGRNLASVSVVRATNGKVLEKIVLDWFKIQDEEDQNISTFNNWLEWSLA